MHLEKNKVYAVIGVSEWTATTVKTLAKFTGQLDRRGRPVFTKAEPRARKGFCFQNLTKDTTLVFEGDVPFKIDSEIVNAGTTPGIVSTSFFRGNACINFVGDPAVIRDYCTHRNLNSNFSKFDIILRIDGEKEIPLYDRVPTSHTVVQRIRAQAV